MLKKSELRKQILNLRSSLSKEEQISKSRVIKEKLLQLEQFKNSDNLLIYADYNGEVKTKEIIEECFKLGKRVACPKVLADGLMDFFEIKSIDELKEGYKGILEPEEKEIFQPDNALVIMPGVAFDNKGYRIGYGKGFYDIYLSRHSNYETIALAYKCQIIDCVPKDEYDRKVDIIITEE